MIYVVAFDPIKFLTCWALKNDRQNLSFVKAINVVGEKRPEIPIKWPTPSFVIFISKQSLFFKMISLVPIYAPTNMDRFWNKCSLFYFTLTRHPRIKDLFRTS